MTTVYTIRFILIAVVAYGILAHPQVITGIMHLLGL